jgi:hypothetical protein
MLHRCVIHEGRDDPREVLELRAAAAAAPATVTVTVMAQDVMLYHPHQLPHGVVFRRGGP